MKKHIALINRHFTTGLSSFFFFILSAVLNAQTPVNFSGTWVQDNVKSDEFYKNFNITLSITQDAQTINLNTTFFDKDGKEITRRSATFNLDGKEVVREVEGATDKDIATWSADKKTLTTKSTRTAGNDVYGSTETYSVSADGQALTVKTEDINPLGLKVTQIFNRKK